MHWEIPCIFHNASEIATATIAPAPIPLPILIKSIYMGVTKAIAESALGPKPATQTVSIKL